MYPRFPHNVRLADWDRTNIFDIARSGSGYDSPFHPSIVVPWLPHSVYLGKAVYITLLPGLSPSFFSHIISSYLPHVIS